MHRSISVFVALGLACSSAYAQSLPKLKPGAWEMTSTSTPDASAMRDQLAKMPPQIREMMEKSMLRGPQTTVTKHCVTPKDEAFGQDVMARMGGNVKCDTIGMRQSGNTYSWTSRCAGTMGPGGVAIKSESTHQLTTSGDTYQHKMSVKSEGGPMGGNTTESSSSGRFLGADCKANGALTLDEQMRQAGAARDGKRPPR